MVSIGLISNPYSGRNRASFYKFSQKVKECDVIHHIATTSPDQIRPALGQLADQGVEFIAINGGDGTCSAVLGEIIESGLFASHPTIALLPGGTANMNAGDIGIGGSLASAAERFCRWSRDPRSVGSSIVQRRILRVVTSPQAQPNYGMFLGGGVVIQGTEYAHQNIHSRGLRDDFSLVLGTLRTAWGVIRRDPLFRKSVSLTLKLDHADCIEHEALIVAISTLERLAFGMRPFWGRQEGAIRITVIDDKCSRFGATFLSILRGRPNGNAVPQNGYYSHTANQIVFSINGKLNLDGEILNTSGPVDVTTSSPISFLKL